MIKCTVKYNNFGHLEITFETGKTLYIQQENDVAAFGVSCGVIDAPVNWDGQTSNLCEDWFCADFEAITECPGGYETIAE